MAFLGVPSPPGLRRATQLFARQRITQNSLVGFNQAILCISLCCKHLRGTAQMEAVETGYAIHTSTCLSKVMYSRSKSSSKPSLLMNVASSSPSPLGRKESISICSAKSTLYWDSFL